MWGCIASVGADRIYGSNAGYFFMHDTKIVVAGVGMLRYQVSSMVFVGIVLVTTCVFQSMGKALSAFVLSACRQGAVLVVILAITSWMVGYQGVICAQPISDCLTALLAGSLLIGTIRREWNCNKNVFCEILCSIWWWKFVKITHDIADDFLRKINMFLKYGNEEFRTKKCPFTNVRR